MITFLLRIFLFPLAVLYDWITQIRNFLYDRRFFQTVESPVLSISVGNLSVGGTGKTPFVAYLIGLIDRNQETAVVSRGYGRKTKGLRIAEKTSSPAEIGDEPLQLLLNFPEIVLIVAEKRILTFPLFHHKFPQIKYLILDDAYQHRSAGRHFNILLTDYSRLFSEDFVLPAGRLRESRKGAKRASAVIVTKCPVELENQEKEKIRTQIAKYTLPETPIFFAKIKYFEPKPVFENTNLGITKTIILITGIAHTEALRRELTQTYEILEYVAWADHVAYDLDKIREIKTKYDFWKKKKENISLLSTEKDAVKLRFFTELADFPIFYLPIQTAFLESEKGGFEDWFLGKINSDLSIK